MRFLRRRRVPKEFLKPRPMSGAPPKKHPLLGYAALQLAAIFIGASVGALALLGSLDDRWREIVLLRTSGRAPPEHLALVEVSPPLAKTAECGRSIATTLTRGGARAGLVLEPLSSLCDGVFDTGALDSELAPPIEPLARDALRAGPSSEAVGFTSRVGESRMLHALGLRPARWVRLRRPESIPTLALDELASGDASPDLLSDKIAVLALSGATQGSTTPRRTAALIAGALEEPPLRRWPTWALGVLALALGAAATQLHRVLSKSQGWGLGLLLVTGGFTAVAGLELLGVGLSLPLASLFAGTLTTYLTLLAPRRAAVARADRDAHRVLSRAGRLLSTEARICNEEEFWRRLARTAAQTHPADDVLIAELPPFSWRLKIWPNGETDESIIKERRRDIRRTPYANLQGVPVASVVEDYLVMKGTPTVLVPLIAADDVEGYLILIGKSAAEEFMRGPRLAEGLARELSNIIRESRLAKMRHQALRGGTAMGEALAEQRVLERAQAAIAELKLLGALVQNAPVGLFYADSFGDVRILGRPVARWLPDFGIELPALNDEGILDAGVLTLKHLLGGFARKAGVSPPAITEIDEDGYTLDAPVPPKSGRRVKSLRVRVLPLRHGSGEEATGFVGSVNESAIFSASMAPRPSIMTQTESLQVFSLSKLLTTIVGDVSLRTEGKVKLQTPRDEAHVVAHRADVERALEVFLIDAATHAGRTAGPVLAIRERRLRVELRVLDLRLDAPTVALERTLVAPSAPPPGLDSLAALVEAVENSHGEVRIRVEESWGTVVTASFVRARPRVRAAPEVAPLRLYDKPATLR